MVVISMNLNNDSKEASSKVTSFKPSTNHNGLLERI